ncbi:MAG: polysaccharide deacetylase family protein [Pseudomonadota bacterium]
MALDNRYLEYPHRSHGMDHDRYDWSMLTDRKPVTWPGGKGLALWVNVCLQFFPLDQRGVPFKVPGGMTMPYPDLRHFSLRDYGNRVGIYRVLDCLDAHAIRPTFAMNTRLAERVPYLVGKIRERGDEVLCHGLHMDALHYGGQDETEERGRVKRALDGLRELTGQSIDGWLSPARSESGNTPDLLAEHGVRYFCDWVNDDMPYRFRTRAGELTAMPLSQEIEDSFVILNNGHSEESWADQVIDACDLLLGEARAEGGRILALNIHPWLLGQPHRMVHLDRALGYVMGHSDVWSAGAREIHDAWLNQQ